MKKLKVLLALVSFFAFCSCSESDGADPDPQPTGPAGQSVYNFTAQYAPVAIDAEDMTAVKRENKFVISGRGIQLSFDDQGRFEKFSLTFYPTGYTQVMTRKSYPEYPSNFFEFNMVSLDTVNQRIQLNFEGLIYQNMNYMSQDFTQVSGDFDVYYFVDVPLIEGIHNDARIDGEPRSQLGYANAYEVGGQWYHYSLTSKDDGPYKITLLYKKYIGGIAEGTFAFDPSLVTNKMVLSKFNPQTMSYVDYECTGSFTIDEINSVGYAPFTFKGTYNFTAVNPTNPSDVIQVTDGSFKHFHPYTQ